METCDEKNDRASLKNDEKNERVSLDNDQKNESATLGNDQKDDRVSLDNDQKNDSAAMKNDQNNDIVTMRNDQKNARVTQRNDHKNARVTLRNDQKIADERAEMTEKMDKQNGFALFALALLGLVAILGMGGIVLWNISPPITGYAVKDISDTTAPTVSYTEPENYAMNVPLNKDIFAAFSEAMSEQTVTGAFTVTGPDGTQIAGTVKNVGRTGIFTPNNDLKPNTRYTAKISSGADDLAGNAMRSDYVWAFTTGTGPDSNAPLFQRYSHISVEVEDHQNIGVFSIGGLFGNNWEKLTYGYPNPWDGTFLTINVDDRFYTTSGDPRDGIQMDKYNTVKPKIGGSSIVSEWVLPSNIRVVEEWSVIQNTTVLNKVKLANDDVSGHRIGARLLIDTKVGLNDGAPIFIPGKGLITTENEFSQSQLSAGYWKAYNQGEQPTLVAIGFIGGKDGMTSPDKLVVADWKQSKDTAWGYSIDGQQSILSDSSVILYYNPTTVQPGQEKNIQTGYGVGEFNVG
ncbi:MAG: Ig-like domain-containing protein [Candidatus Altiarchaeota archaeon]